MKSASCFLYTTTLLLLACNTKVNNQKNDNPKDSLNISTTAPHSKPSLEDFWKDFDFSDTTKFKNPEYGEQEFADFITLLYSNTEQNINKGIKQWIEKTTHNKVVFKHFDQITAKYLFNVNSPYYNERLYALILQQYIESPHLDKIVKEKYKILLQLINRNNVGTTATNFSFLTDKGEKNSLNNISSDYTVLFFYQPGCPVCAEHITFLKSNPFFEQKLKENTCMLAIYPDGEMEKWKDYQSQIPDSWINGIDPDQTLIKKQLYDLKASPTIYLLDKHKKVLLKDANINQVLQYLKQ